MGLDDTADFCPEHVWRLTTVVLSAGATCEYECERCPAVIVRGPGQVFPGTV